MDDYACFECGCELAWADVVFVRDPKGGSDQMFACASCAVDHQPVGEE